MEVYTKPHDDTNFNTPTFNTYTREIKRANKFVLFFYLLSKGNKTHFKRDWAFVSLFFFSNHFAKEIRPHLEGIATEEHVFSFQRAC